MSALSTRENVRRLVDLVPERDLETIERILQGLLREYDPVLAAFENAPEEEDELSEEMIEALKEARRAKIEGRVFSHEEARRRLGL